MDRRTFLCGLTLGTLAAPLAGKAQPSGRVARLGYVDLRGPDMERSEIRGMREGLRQLGYVEGHTTIE